MQPLSDCTGLFFTVFLLRVFTFFCMSFFIRFFWHGFFYSLSFYLREFFLYGSFEELHGLVFCGGAERAYFFFGVQSPVIAARNNRQPFDLFFCGSALDKVCAPCRRKIRKFFKKV